MPVILWGSDIGPEWMSLSAMTDILMEQTLVPHSEPQEKSLH